MKLTKTIMGYLSLWSLAGGLVSCGGSYLEETSTVVFIDDDNQGIGLDVYYIDHYGDHYLLTSDCMLLADTYDSRVLEVDNDQGLHTLTIYWQKNHHQINTTIRHNDEMMYQSSGTTGFFLAGNHSDYDLAVDSVRYQLSQQSTRCL